MVTYHRLTRVPAPRADVFAWHQREGAFERLKPPWVDMMVLRHDGIANGAQVELRVTAPFVPIAIDWHFQHTGFIQDEQFVDRQIRGPFRSWQHIHRFVDDGNGCVIDDSIEFALPLPVPLVPLFIKRELDRLFDYREKVLQQEFADH